MKLIRNARDGEFINSRQKPSRQKYLRQNFVISSKKTANRSFEKDFVTPAKAGVQTGSPSRD